LFDLYLLGEHSCSGISQPVVANPAYKADAMQVGQVVALSEVTVEVAEMTSDGRLAQAAFMFAYPLEDDRYGWLLWDEDTLTHKRVQMPPVGESRVYPFVL
jgi:hypothetical protein